MFLVRELPLAGSAASMALTSDEALLVGAAGAGVKLVRLESTT